MLENFAGKSAAKLICIARRFVVTALRSTVKLVVVLLVLAVLCNVHDRLTTNQKHLGNVYGREPKAD